MPDIADIRELLQKESDFIYQYLKVEKPPTQTIAPSNPEPELKHRIRWMATQFSNAAKCRGIDLRTDLSPFMGESADVHGWPRVVLQLAGELHQLNVTDKLSEVEQAEPVSKLLLNAHSRERYYAEKLGIIDGDGKDVQADWLRVVNYLVTEHGLDHHAVMDMAVDGVASVLQKDYEAKTKLTTPSEAPRAAVEAWSAMGRALERNEELSLKSTLKEIWQDIRKNDHDYACPGYEAFEKAIGRYKSAHGLARNHARRGRRGRSIVSQKDI